MVMLALDELVVAAKSSVGSRLPATNATSAAAKNGTSVTASTTTTTASATPSTLTAANETLQKDRFSSIKERYSEARGKPATKKKGFFSKLSGAGKKK